MRRRDVLLGTAALAAGEALRCREAHALGRVPVGGDVTFRIPWSPASIDPHELHDPMAALFGPAIADPVYARDGRGRIHPTLADGMPKVDGDETIVKLRGGLKSGRGLALGGRDLAWSLTRARKRGAIGMFASVTPFIRSDPERPLIARFGKIAPQKLALMLTSPLCALLPVGFKASAPDGTGAFKAVCTPARLVLTRNPNAARGASFLERVTAQRAGDIADSLRAFESGQDDIGWLGLGFHSDRPSARKFDYRDVGWIVLCTGSNAGSFAATGMAQQLANHVQVERLGVGMKARATSGGSREWTGGSATLLFDASSAHMNAIAQGVAAKLSSSGAVTARGVSRAQLRGMRKSGNYALALDFVRRPGAGSSMTAIALATADRPPLGEQWGKKPTRTIAGRPAQATARSLRVGVLGGLAVHGGVVKGMLLAPQPDGRGIDWGASYRS